MPKIMLFAACEKLVIDENGLVSLISLIEKVHASASKAIDPGGHFAIPLNWHVLSYWHQIPGEAGKQFEQKVELVAENGIVAMHTEPQPIRFADGKKGSKTKAVLSMIPITDGNLLLRLLFREVGVDEWSQVAEYAIDVELTTT